MVWCVCVLCVLCVVCCVCGCVGVCVVCVCVYVAHRCACTCDLYSLGEMGVVCFIHFQITHPAPLLRPLNVIRQFEKRLLTEVTKREQLSSELEALRVQQQTLSTSMQALERLVGTPLT